jgi:hypothetical protein
MLAPVRHLPSVLHRPVRIKYRSSAGRRLVRDLLRACSQPPLELVHPSLGLGLPLDREHGGDHIRDLKGLARRKSTLGTSGEERARGLDQVAGAGDVRQIERDRVIAPRRQQKPDAEAQRRPVARQGLGDERAHERLGGVLEQGLERQTALVAGAFRPSPWPSAAGGRGRLRPAARHGAPRRINGVHARSLLSAILADCPRPRDAATPKGTDNNNGSSRPRRGQVGLNIIIYRCNVNIYSVYCDEYFSS